MRMRAVAVVGAAAAIAAGLGVTGGPVAAAAKAARPGDFNGDGIQDLVAASPEAKVGGTAGAGLVTVLYGARSGPKAAGHQIIDRTSAGVPDDPADYGMFGRATTSADFDRDGYADLAIVSGDSTSVLVVYGGKKGLTSRTLTLPVQDIRPTDLAVGDFDKDGAVDLVVTGSQDEPRPKGAYWVFSGLKTSPVQGVKTEVSVGAAESLGWLRPVAADFTGDGYTDLALQVAGNTDGENHGENLKLRLGSAHGLGPATAVAVPNPGRAAAAGDINGDRKADLVIQEHAGGDAPGQGAVHVLPGKAGGLGKAARYSQDTAGVPGTGEGGEGNGDDFGATLALADVNGDGRADLALGAPLEDVGRVQDAGAVTLLYGGAKGLTTKGAQIFGQNTKGVPGDPELADSFGRDVSLVDLNGDGKADLAAGSVGEDRTEGRLHILRGGRTGVTVKGVVSFGPGSFGIARRIARLGDLLLP